MHTNTGLHAVVVVTRRWMRGLWLAVVVLPHERHAIHHPHPIHVVLVVHHVAVYHVISGEKSGWSGAVGTTSVSTTIAIVGGTVVVVVGSLVVLAALGRRLAV